MPVYVGHVLRLLLLIALAALRTTATANSAAAALEAHLLGALGLTSRPHPNHKVVPQYMMELYRLQRDLNHERGAEEEEETDLTRVARLANTVRSFTHSEMPLTEEEERHRPGRLHLLFNVTGFPVGERLKAAELRLYRRRRTSLSNLASSECTISNSNSNNTKPSARKIRIEVFDVVRIKPDLLLRLVDTRLVDPGQKSGWESFDVFPAAVRWWKKPATNRGLYVRVTSTSRCPSSDENTVRLRKKDIEDASWNHQRPLLVTFSEDSSSSTSSSSAESSGGVGSKRSKRAAKDRKERVAVGGGGGRRKGARDMCRRHNLSVDFSDVGWNDWIVAPPGYQAFYCHGECEFPLADHLNSTNHAVVQTLMNSVKPGVVPRVCCVPTELKPISMLYLDQYDRVVLKNYQDMVVEGCGCR